MSTALSTIVDLSPIVQTVVGLLSAVVMGLGGLAIHALNVWLSAKTGHQNLINEDTVRGYLHSALDNAVHYAVGKIGSGDWSKIDVKNALIAEAASYALAHVPDALAYFKIDEKGLEDLIIAKLGKLVPLVPAPAPPAA